MARLKKSRYFEISELVSPKILQLLSVEACWNLIPEYMIYGLDKLRELYGAPIIINDGVNYTESGIRTLDCSIGAKYSAHKCFRNLIGVDLKCKDQDKLRNIIEDNYSELHISEVENYIFCPTWTHVAFSAERPSKLKIINP